ncbi:MAG: N4-gp56 family major capsid protein [Oscillospiraceae bacterium]|nr:N4-gp56 family major capsid protein [Oscillospiraceae bacterium]
MKLFENLFIHADSGSVVNLTTNGTTGTVDAYTGVYDASQTTTQSMSATMKDYYDTELLENARPKLIFSQLGKQQSLPRKHGKTVSWRKWNTFETAMTPLKEGVIPTGQKFGITETGVEIQQYGDYTAISDQLEMHAIDPVIQGATEEMGAAGGATADTLVRNVLCTGTSVIYADTLDANGVPTSTPKGRYQMAPTNNRLTPDAVNKAYTFLKKKKAPFYEGNKYIAVIHPSVTYDLRSSTDWLDVHKYDATREIFEGEIGELHGVRFVENTEAPIFVGANLFGSTRNLTVATASVSGSATAGQTTTYGVVVSETLTAAMGTDLIGRKVHIYETGETSPFTGTVTIVGTDYANKKLFFDKAAPATIAASDKLYPGEGGASTDPCAVYATMFFGKDAFAVVDPEGMGMEMIIKGRDQVGGPLNQFSTVGYKFENASKILYEERMVRVESCSAYSTVDEDN